MSQAAGEGLDHDGQYWDAGWAWMLVRRRSWTQDGTRGLLQVAPVVASDSEVEAPVGPDGLAA